MLCPCPNAASSCACPSWVLSSETGTASGTETAIAADAGTARSAFLIYRYACLWCAIRYSNPIDCFAESEESVGTQRQCNCRTSRVLFCGAISFLEALNALLVFDSYAGDPYSRVSFYWKNARVWRGNRVGGHSSLGFGRLTIGHLHCTFGSSVRHFPMAFLLQPQSHM